MKTSSKHYRNFYQMKVNEIIEQQTQAEITPENEVYIVPYTVKTNESSQGNYKDHETALYSLLKDDFQVMERDDDKKKKENALIKINDILINWMKRVNEKEDIGVIDQNPNTSRNYARLLCYGSYKLGVSSPNGDIDALVLSPDYVKRDEHFFGDLFELLQQYSKDNDNITGLTSVNYEHSITPLIKMDFYGVDVDLIFANIEDVTVLDGYVNSSGLSERPSVYNDILMEKMDDKMKRSYNGFRNAEMILDSIILENEREDIETVKRKIYNFRMCLRCVKIMAKVNGISENKVGYLGGIAYAILTSKIVQMFPNYSFCWLLERYLYIYGFEWNWDKWWVRIVEKRDKPQADRHAKVEEETQMFIPIQDSIPKKTKQRSMNIITPAWPQMNSTYNVTFSTREVILNTFRKKHGEILKKLAFTCFHDQQFNLKENWKLFFRKFKFFEKHDQYLEFIIVGKEEETFLRWKGFIEAKIRFFIETLEVTMSFFNFTLQIWPTIYDKDQIKSQNKYHESLNSYNFFEKIFIGMTIHEDYDDPIDLQYFVIKFLSKINFDWQKDNGQRDAHETNIFCYLLDKEEIVLGKGVEEDKLLKKRDKPCSLENSEIKEEKRKFEFESFLKIDSTVQQEDVSDNEQLMDDLLD